MRNTISLLAIFAFLLFSHSVAKAQSQLVTGGNTSVLLDTSTLASVGLTISSVSSNVIVPGSLGPDSVAFGINSRTDFLPTTFVYTAGGLAPFMGTIEHSGSVFFNADSIEVGNFTIGFDGNRAGGINSGFFVESTVGLSAILFDIENPGTLVANPDTLTIGANLRVSPEFASVLGNSSLTGALLGEALVSASAIPEPSSVLILALGTLFFLRRNRS
jgi:hypothetical protein